MSPQPEKHIAQGHSPDGFLKADCAKWADHGTKLAAYTEALLSWIASSLWEMALTGQTCRQGLPHSDDTRQGQ